MCKLVPLRLGNGDVVDVAEHKREMLEQYLGIFSKYADLRKVVLFGSVLETRCSLDSDIDLCLLHEGARKVYHKLVCDIFLEHPETANDDMIGYNIDDFETGPLRGAMIDVKRKGVVIYDSNW